MRSTPGPSDRVADVEPQRIRVLYDLAREHDAPDRDVVHLEVGEPDFDTPEHVVDAAVRAARDGRTNYTANAGVPALREALADRLDSQGLAVDPATDLVVTTGGVEALYLAILSVADPGDEVLIPTPAWPNTVSQTRLASAVPVAIPLNVERGFALDPDAIIERMTDRTAAVVLTSPSNPTGRVHDVAAIERIVEAAVSYGAYVIADEVYRDLTYGDPQPRVGSYTEHPECVLTVGSFSKTYAMTGWRVGWLAGPEPILSQVTKIHESTTSCVSTPAQYAALAALDGPDDRVREMKAAFERRREYVTERLDAMDAVALPEPEGAFYAFPDVSALEQPSMELAKRLLYEYDLVVAPGTAFGDAGEGHVRLSFANSLDRLELGLDRFERLLRDEVG